MDVSSLCRSCMKEVASWEREKFDARAVEMFSFCTNLRITEEDQLPQQFCYSCLNKIESSYSFIIEAQKVHVTLKNIVSRSDTSIIVEPDTCLKTHNPEIKLTLPDYKICSVVEDTRPYELGQKKLVETVDLPVETGNFEDNVEPINEKEIGIDRSVNKPEIAIDSNVCPVCRKSFSRPSQLTSHSVSHSEERKFACSACGKRFKRPGNLKVHMRMHTGEKPYACATCPFRAAVASNLRRHERVHACARDHVCAHCGKTFQDRSNLCPACPSAFTDSWKRKAHLMRSHKVPLHDIPRMRTDGRVIQ
ncbi:Uncharacterized protein OBRU01_23680 [Operophtera brumata]|uniref:Uncharacterized protein n=1 Tax=Operophtera brumata TaxID=104452 RepID=A0A0L7KQC8_OPEBR|nr:Uncharacterized protein OBRU01_23680 [Operophtera brumata]